MHKHDTRPTASIVRFPNMQSDSGLVDLPSTGVALEFKLWAPLGDEDRKLAVFLHPWSWLGGQMNDPVLHSLVDVFCERGYHVLQYNSRGVGRSSGRATFTGIEEGKDLEAIVQWALDELGGVSTVVIVGYSHGSLIATLHPALENNNIKTGHILLSYPLGPRMFLTLFQGAYYEQKLKELESKILIVFGGRDEFTSYERYRAWAAELEGDRVRVFSVPDGSHFWRNELRDPVSLWLLEL